jgi:hypothetical protein
MIPILGASLELVRHVFSYCQQSWSVRHSLGESMSKPPPLLAKGVGITFLGRVSSRARC